MQSSELLPAPQWPAGGQITISLIAAPLLTWLEAGEGAGRRHGQGEHERLAGGAEDGARRLLLLLLLLRRLQVLVEDRRHLLAWHGRSSELLIVLACQRTGRLSKVDVVRLWHKQVALPFAGSRNVDFPGRFNVIARPISVEIHSSLVINVLARLRRLRLAHLHVTYGTKALGLTWPAWSLERRHTRPCWPPASFTGSPVRLAAAASASSGSSSAQQSLRSAHGLQRVQMSPALERHRAPLIRSAWSIQSASIASTGPGLGSKELLSHRLVSAGAESAPLPVVCELKARSDGAHLSARRQANKISRSTRTGFGENFALG